MMIYRRGSTRQSQVPVLSNERILEIVVSAMFFKASFVRKA
jgi:hypothetical protein